MQRDLARTTLAVLFIGILIASSLLILWPFLAATIWATMIVVATWPLLLSMQARFGGRRGPAVAVMTVAMLMVFVLPFTAAILTIFEYAGTIGDWARTFAQIRIPPPPEFVDQLPFVGHRITALWNEYAALPAEGLAARVQPYAVAALKWLGGEAGSVGKLAVQFLLTVILAAVLYADGETAASTVRGFARRLSPERGEDVVVLAGQAIRGVALGVVVTALVQSLLGGIGLAIAGVPFAAVLTALMLLLCLAQLGPTLVLLPATVWMFWTGDNVWGSVLLVWTVVVGTLDNFLRPWLIKKGADLPLLLIFAGVIGGLVSIGMVGIFVGPVVLAVAYRLVGAFIRDTPSAPPDSGQAR